MLRKVREYTFRNILFIVIAGNLFVYMYMWVRYLNFSSSCTAGSRFIMRSTYDNIRRTSTMIGVFYKYVRTMLSLYVQCRWNWCANREVRDESAFITNAGGDGTIICKRLHRHCTCVSYVRRYYYYYVRSVNDFRLFIIELMPHCHNYN